MRGIVHVSRRLLAAAAIVLAGTAAGNAAGALAIGSCAAYGSAYNFSEAQAAQAAALKKCKGACKVVATMRNGCAAYAVDIRNSCGPHGYASAPTLGRAENAALRYCYKYGGRDCVVRAFVCDGSS